MPDNTLFSQVIYIARSREERILKSWLADLDSGKPILYICGPGGVGKTLLLRQLEKLNESQDSTLIITEIVDLYLTENRQIAGIVSNILNQLKPLTNLEHHVTDKINRALEVISRTQNVSDIKDAFLEVCKDVLRSRPLLIRFDTFEHASEFIIEWIYELIEGICAFKKGHSVNNSLYFAIAGRENNQQDLSVFSEWWEIVRPSSFTQNEIVQYYYHEGINDISEHTAAKLAELSQGKPILIALSIDWIKYADKTADDLIKYGPLDFEKQMVERVRELDYPENEVIFVMAHLHKRLDTEILSVALECDIDKSNYLIDLISKYSFVKTRKSDYGGTECQLHDEMVRLMNAYAWIGLDETRQKRQIWSEKVVNIYNKRIETCDSTALRQALSLEKLGYICDYSPQRAFSFWNSLHEQYNDEQLESREAINKEIRRVYDDLDEPSHRLIKSREATVLYQHGKSEEAITVRENLLSDPNIEPVLKAGQLARLIEMYAESGPAKEALDFANKANQWFSNHPVNLFSESEQERINRYFGMFHTNYGYVLRKQGNQQQALAHYSEAITYFKGAGKRAYSNIGALRTNLAYLHHLVGDDHLAVKECEIAIKYREKFDKADLGLSYNVMGMIRAGQLRDHQSEYWFDRAKDFCRQYGSKRGEALVNLAHGRLLRQQGWCTVGLEPDNSINPLYEKARELLESAVNNLKQDLPYYAEALNDLGTLLRNQQNYNEALKCYQISLEVSEHNNLDYWQADNYQDRAVTYILLSEETKKNNTDYGDIEEYLKKAEDDANIAQTIGKQIRSPQTISRSYRTLADVAYSRGNYEQAFKQAIASIHYLLQIDQYSPNDSPAKKESLFDEWLLWLTNMLIKLPDAKQGKLFCAKLIKDWAYSEGSTEESKKRANDFFNRFHDYQEIFDVIV